MSEPSLGPASWSEAWGERLFRARGWLPVPLALAMVLGATPPSGAALALGLGLSGAGLTLRLWGVAHIGPGSRRRTAEVGALATTGPYRRMRNPLYVGNMLCWAGLGLLSGRPALAPLSLALFAAHYRLIVAWEEARLAYLLGAPYIAWRRQVPRWLPALRASGPPGPGDWRRALRSERSTHLVTLLLCAAILGAGRP